MNGEEVVGLDVGGARTKVVRARDGATWEGSSPPVANSAFLRALLDSRGSLPVPVHRATAVVAAPDRWRIGRQPNPVPLASTTAGADWVRALTRDVGFDAVRLVPGLQCVAASEVHADPEPGCVLACDVGATAVDAAVYTWDGRVVRLLDAEHADVGADDPDSLLLGDLAEPAGDRNRTVVDPAAQLRSIADDRCANGRRIDLLLRRARRQERYWDTPVCLPRRGRATTARELHTALQPVARTAAAVLRRLTDRVEDTPRPALVLTGGNALGPVVDAALGGANDLVGSVRVVPPITAARGATLIGRGAVVAVDDYPHQLGVPARHIRAGMLFSTVAPLCAGEPLVIDVSEEDTGSFPVAVRIEGEGPWRDAVPAGEVALTPGRHRVRLATHRAGLGGVVLTHEDSGVEVTRVLAARAGDLVAPDGHRGPR